MQVSQDVFRFVPLQNFTNQSDIDWMKTTEDIDRQLYVKYGLTKQEINYIESKTRLAE